MKALISHCIFGFGLGKIFLFSFGRPGFSLSASSGFFFPFVEGGGYPPGMTVMWLVSSLSSGPGNVIVH